ncbi:tyrosine-type recombinase/integrase [Natrinema amylolyticum]|uniref:tyrosine-type recombinase/integrase n=1 Tax=Natrinema amylolyticum TaxID=2878679 RepID=UPI001CFA9AD5|nr:tyrosine-type recombinase/integrase [Natrinema amylolyticum]
MANIEETPRAVVEQFQKEREHEVRESTLINQKYHLRSFIEWTEETGLEQIGALNGFILNQYKTWRRENSEINEQTLYNNLTTLRALLGWCEQRELVEEGLTEKLDIPKPENPVKNETIAPERANQILEYYHRFEYASRDHVLFYLLYHTGMRVGTVHALDVGDWESEEGLLHIRHRPEQGTPLKNGKDGQRAVAISKDGLITALSDYIRHNRLEKVDENDRKPLFPTRQGRASTQTLRLYVEHLSEPCQYTGECPHGKDLESCDARRKMRDSYECPSAVSPHPIRRSAITDHLNSDVPKDVVSDRMNVSQKVLDKHYDARTEEEKANTRKQYLDNI